MRQTRAQSLSSPVRPAREEDEEAYALLEEARLRCEQLQTDICRDRHSNALRAIHRALGMAGWAASTELDPHRRQALLARVHDESVSAMRHPVAEHALVEVVIEAEDALGGGVRDAEQDEHLHLAHAHLLHAMDLLYIHLYGQDPAYGGTGSE